MATILLTVHYLSEHTESFEIRDGGDWFLSPMPSITHQQPKPDHIIIRPKGSGLPRFQIPLMNVAFYQLEKVE